MPYGRDINKKVQYSSDVKSRVRLETEFCKEYMCEYFAPLDTAICPKFSCIALSTVQSYFPVSFVIRGKCQNTPRVDRFLEKATDAFVELVYVTHK